jgi:hypothetical protein
MQGKPINIQMLKQAYTKSIEHQLPTHINIFALPKTY